MGKFKRFCDFRESYFSLNHDDGAEAGGPGPIENKTSEPSKNFPAYMAQLTSEFNQNEDLAKFNSFSEVLVALRDGQLNLNTQPVEEVVDEVKPIVYGDFVEKLDKSADPYELISNQIKEFGIANNLEQDKLEGLFKNISASFETTKNKMISEGQVNIDKYVKDTWGFDYDKNISQEAVAIKCIPVELMDKIKSQGLNLIPEFRNLLVHYGNLLGEDGATLKGSNVFTPSTNCPVDFSRVN